MSEEWYHRVVLLPGTLKPGTADADYTESFLKPLDQVGNLTFFAQCWEK